MRNLAILLSLVSASGCATQRHSQTPQPATAAIPVVREATPTRVAETRYEVRSYRDAADPSVRHAAHTVFRTTRVPAHVEALETAPRTSFAPASHAPLPQSAELSAELEAQRLITAELREIKARMAAIETQAQGHYGSLVNQTAESLRLRQQLAAERSRVVELEAQLRAGSATAATTAAPVVATNEPKW